MPSGQSLWNQLLSSNRRRSKGSLDKSLGYAWGGVRLAEAGAWQAAEADDPEETRKWLNTMAQCLNIYLKLSQSADLETRVKALENAAGLSHE